MEAIDHTPEPLTSTLRQRGHPHMLRGDILALRLHARMDKMYYGKKAERRWRESIG